MSIHQRQQRRNSRPEDPELVALVDAAKRGNRNAFGRLYERYVGMVHAIALGVVPHDYADDVVQEVFVRALTQLHALRAPAAFGGWLASMARNTAINVRRAEYKLADLAEEGATPETQHDALEARAVLEAIRDLPKTYRETLLMRLVAGLTGPEIAARSGLTPASVRVNLHRGMKLLRNRLNAAGTNSDARRTS